MANIGSLTANLRLESAAFQRDMRKAAAAVQTNTAKMRKSMRQVETAARGVERSFRGLRAGLGALAGALAIRQFASFTRSSINSAAAIKDVADKVALTTKELQQMRFAAAQTGVAQTALDMGMQRFSRRLGEVAQGQGELLNVAKQYNIQLRDNEGRMRSNIDILKDFADVIKDAESDQERLRIAFKLFDSEGAALVNTLRAGRVGLEEFMAQAVAFGAVMSDDVIARAKLASDNLAALEMVFKTGFDTGIIEGFADSLTLTSDGFKAARETGEQFGRAIGITMRGVAAAAKFVAANMREIVTILSALIALKAAGIFIATAAAVGKFAIALLQAAKAGVLVNAIMSKSILGAIAKLLITVGGAAAAWELWGKEAKAAIAAVEKSIKGALPGLSSVGKATEDAANAMRFEKVQSEQLLGALKRSRAEYDKLKKAIELENLASAKNVDLSTQAGKAWLESARANQTLREEIEKTLKAQDEAAEKQKRLIEEQRELFLAPFKNAIEGIQGAFSDAFENIFSGGVDSFSDLASTVKRIFIKLAAEIATLLIFRPVVRDILGFVGLGGVAQQLGFGGTGTPGATGANGAGGAGGAGGLGTLTSGASAASTLFSGGSEFLGNLFIDLADELNLGLSLAVEDSIAAALDSSGFGAIGSFAASLLGLSGPASVVTAPIGSIAGALIGGPVGAAIGGFLGSALGGLFGGSQTLPVPRAGSLLSVANGDFLATGIREGEGGKFSVTNQIAEGIGGAIDQLAESLGATIADGFVAGVGLSGRKGGELQLTLNEAIAQGIGRRDLRQIQPQTTDIADFLGQAGFLALDLRGKSQEEIDRLVKDASQLVALSALTTELAGGISGAAKTALAKSIEDFTTLTAKKPGGQLTNIALDIENITKDVELIKFIEGLNEPAEELSEFAKAVKAVNDQFDSLVERATRLELSTVKLEEARADALQRLETQLRVQVATPFAAAGAGLIDFVRGQRLDQDSSLSPTGRLTEAQRQFADLLERTRGGDASLVGALTSAASNVLSFGRENFASTVSFANLESNVISSLLSVAELFTSDSFIDAQVEAVKQQTAVIQDGDAALIEAINLMKREIELLRMDLAA